MKGGLGLETAAISGIPITPDEECLRVSFFINLIL